MKKPTDALSRHDQQLLDQLTSIFAAHGGSMTQQKFDEVFMSARAPGFMHGWSGKDRLWGELGGSDWSCWLDLLQHAVWAGVASQTGKVPNVTYHLPAKP